MLEPMLTLICYAAFGIASFTDIRSKTIPDWVHLIILSSGIVQMIMSDMYWEPLCGFFILGGSILLIASLCGGLGGGDVKLIATSCLLFGFSTGVFGLLFSFSLFVIYWVLSSLIRGKKSGSLCYAPFHGAGFILAFILIGGY